MVWLLVIAVGLLVASTSGSGGTVEYPNGGYHTKVWEPLAQALAIPAGLPWQLVVRWVDLESGGNPCAVGKSATNGPKGLPREVGLGQLYNPDDFAKLNYNPSEFRAYCVPGTQRCSRPLTPAEMSQQVRAVVDLANRCRRDAERDMTQNGVAWRGRDLWALTKLQHGLPGLSRSGLPAVVKSLGRPPTSFQEFHATLSMLSPKVLDAGTRAYMDGATTCGLSPTFTKVMANARNCASAVPEPGVA